MVVAGARNHLNLLFNAPRLEAPLWWGGQDLLKHEPRRLWEWLIAELANSQFDSIGPDRERQACLLSTALEICGGRVGGW